MDDDTGAENRLRELLRDQGWSLTPRPDAMQRIRQAARRQRIKAASTTAGAAAAIAITAIAVPLASSGTQTTQATQAMQATRTPPVSASSVPASTPSKTRRVLPLLVGLSLHEAEATISKAVPRVHVRVRHSNANVPVEIVVQEIPAGGSEVDPGTTVVLVVSGR